MNATPTSEMKTLLGALPGCGERPAAWRRKRQPAQAARAPSARSTVAAYRPTVVPRVASSTPVCTAEFLAEMRREMRRAERCGSALSLVVYDLSDERISAASADRLVPLVCSRKREIDTVGWLRRDTLAVLCPDTDETGALGFTRKIAAAEGWPAHPGPMATYPDALFDDVSAGSAPSPGCLPFLESDAVESLHPPYRLKRAVDVVGALLGLLLTAPLMAAVALAIVATSPGPVIFKQTRLGRAGKPFTFYKFRSMRADADDRLHKEFVAKLIDGLPTRPADAPPPSQRAAYKLHGDPRITPIGRFIRKTSIDELPQFINVLKGEMSLVGPRPPLPYEAALYEAWHLRRLLSITPGITGLWQVNGRSRVSFDEMVRMDIRYQRDCSLAVDLKILLRTLLVVLRCDGAV